MKAPIIPSLSLSLGLLLPFLGCGSPSTAPAGGAVATSATGQLVDDIRRDLEADHNAFHPECRFTRVVSAKGLPSNGEWTHELWTIEACQGRTFTYKVGIQKGKGSNFVMISRTDLP